MSAPELLAQIAAIARARPDQLAVVAPAASEDEEVRLTYRELALEVEALAAAFARANVGRGDRVGLWLPRSADFVVALLATWARGAAWVPIDAAWPDERIGFVARDAELSLVCTVPAWTGRAGALTRAPLVTSEVRAGRAGDLDDRAFSPPGDPAELAYVVYTSGSTGRPKGVRVSHRGLLPVLHAQIRAFRLGPKSRVLQVLSHAFDASLSDIGTALLAGATLVIHDRSLAPSALTKVLAAQAITHVDLPPALLGLLDPRAAPASLETIVIGGEVCAPEIVRAWATRVRLVNVYGPTEATICTSLVVCGSDWDAPRIGAPIGGIAYSVVDDALAPVAAGEGELVIAGPGVALGYVARPELDATKFIDWGSERAFRTGDRVRFDATGELVFVGRCDRQLKVQGKLVAPEEIEACLARDPRVARVAVVPRTTAGGAAGALMAFVALRDDRGAASAGVIADLRALAEAALPAWMVPSRIEIVRELPVTTSGKVDAAALAAREHPAPRASEAPPPRGPIETALAAIVTRILGIERVSRDDDLHALGADSFAILSLVTAAAAEGLTLSEAAISARLPLHELARRALTADATPSATVASLEDDASVAFAAAQAEVPALGAFEARSGRASPDVILLTGATGFVGARLADVLLDDPRVRLLCLVRGDEAVARARLDAAITPGGRPLRAARAARVEVVCGDLASPRLGLSAAEWWALATRVGMVVHVAARVSVVAPYAELREDNVVGTARVAALAQAGTARALHLISSLAVGASARPAPRVFREDDGIDAGASIVGGYAQSKWAAEVVTRLAARSARSPRPPLAAIVTRLGLVTGDRETGRSARDCPLASFAHALEVVGAAPALDDATLHALRVDTTPIDYAARALATLTRSHAFNDAPPATYHLASEPATLAMILAALDMHVPLARLPADAFRAALARHASDPEAALGILGARRRLLADALAHASDLFLATDVTFDAGRAATTTGLARPASTPEYLARVFAATRAAKAEAR